MLSMEQASSLPGSPGAAPLQPMSPDRVNQQREDVSLFSPTRTEQRDSEVHDKIRQFNHLSHLQPMNNMSKQLERKTADAALKRAMLGREEAESEMRRYRDEARALRKQIEEGRERERRVGERLETVMENYGRAKETHSHTQALWEKEIRRARKETFKSQSSIVKLQEELKAARNAIKSTEEVLSREKERSKSREQEAFEARYQLVGLQEKLEKALERVKVIEQERDAYKTLAKNEEVARIAAEGRIPLPTPEGADDEFASPKKGRVSLSTADILSSATSEAEIDELTRLWQWEKQRADRTHEELEFLQAECDLHCCPGAKSQSRKRRGTLTSPRRERPSKVAIIDPADHVILGQKRESLPPQISVDDEPVVRKRSGAEERKPRRSGDGEQKEDSVLKGSRRSMRRSALFVPSEGIFRTLSQQDLRGSENGEESAPEPPSPVEVRHEPAHYARTPSVEPPSFAMMAQERESLLSLLNAPHEDDRQTSIIDYIPTTTADSHSSRSGREQREEGHRMVVDAEADADTEMSNTSVEPPQHGEAEAAAGGPRPHTSAAFYTVTTTTSVPLRKDQEHNSTRPHTIADMPMADSGARTPTFDVNNPALTTTMTREQALAQIRERRARSGAVTPRRQMMTGVGAASQRRDVSAPAGRAGSAASRRPSSAAAARSRT